MESLVPHLLVHTMQCFGRHAQAYITTRASQHLQSTQVCWYISPNVSRFVLALLTFFRNRNR